MSPAPLPPHERPWRHPSELSPTRADVDHEAHRFTLPLIVGSAAMLVIAVLVVAVTPSPSGSEEIALTGSTTPARITPRSTSAASPAGGGTTGRSTSIRAREDAAVRLAAFTAVPNAIAATPALHLEGRRFATELPRPTEFVLVQTETATYRLLWGDLQWLEIEGEAVIADPSLAVIGYIENGHFHPLFDR